MTNTKQFHLGDILSITTGMLVSPRHIDGIYDILNFMTGDDLYTHALPRASGECRPYLAEQFPQLVTVEMNLATTELRDALSGVNITEERRTIVDDWLAKQISQYGEIFSVSPLPKGAHTVKDPFTEFSDVSGGLEKVYVVNVSTPL